MPLKRANFKISVLIRELFYAEHSLEFNFVDYLYAEFLRFLEF